MRNGPAWSRCSRSDLPGRGRPAAPHRRVLDALIWPARTGAPWRTLPERFGPWRTIATRFSRWTASGPWGRIMEALLRRADHAGDLDWSRHRIDSITVRAHQHAAGAKGGSRARRSAAPAAASPPRSTSVCCGEGRPLVLHLTGGERHDQVGFKALLSSLAVKRPQRGRPRSRPGELVADRGHTVAPTPQEPKRRGIRAVIPTRSSEKRQLALDHAAYAERNRVERLIDRLEQYRRVATGYEKRAETYAAFLTLVAIRCWP